MNRMYSFCLVLFLGVGSVSPARLSLKGGLSVTDSLTKKPINVLANNDEYSLTITTGQDIDEHLIEGIAEGGFVLGGGMAQSQTAFSFNGQVSQEITTGFSLRPTQTGDFTLGPAIINGNQGEEMSNTVTVRVVSQERYDELAGRAGGKRGTSRATRTCTLSVSPERVVVGEPVRVTILLENNGNTLRWGPEDLSFKGLSATKDGELLESVRHANGKEIRQLSQSYIVTPEAPGTFSIGPATGLFVVPDNSNPFGGGMMEFFGGMVNRGKQRRVESAPVTLTVDPLPKTHLMVDGIGQFESLEARMTTRATQINEPLELSLVLRGEGNFEAIVAPELQVPSYMTVYDSGTDFFPAGNDPRAGAKVFKYVVQIGEPGQHQLPAQEFVFFDTATRKYRVLRSEAQAITVKGVSGVAATMQSAPATLPPVEEEVEEPEPEVLLPEIDTATLPTSSPLQGFGWWWFVLVALLPLFFLLRRQLSQLGFAITELTGVTSQYKRDVAYLDALIAAGTAGDLQEFFIALLARRWQVEESLVDAAYVGSETKRFGWPHSKRNQFNDFIDSCGQAAFAPELMSERDKQELLKKSLYWFELITHAPLLEVSEK